MLKNASVAWRLIVVSKPSTVSTFFRELEHPPTCITFHPGFKPVCLEVWSLRLAGRKYRKLDKKKYQQTDSENRYKFSSENDFVANDW